jgi:hypothetical protein
MAAAGVSVDGLMDATSNVGPDAAVCANAALSVSAIAAPALSGKLPNISV